MHQHGFAGLQPARLEHIGPDGEDGFGQGGGLGEVEPIWNRQHVTGVDHGVFRIAAAAQQGADPVAQAPARDAVAQRVDLARDFKPQNAGRTGWRRIAALALEQIGTVHAGRAHADADLAGTGLWRRMLGQVQRLGGSAAALDLDRLHRSPLPKVSSGR